MEKYSALIDDDCKISLENISLLDYTHPTKFKKSIIASSKSTKNRNLQFWKLHKMEICNFRNSKNWKISFSKVPKSKKSKFPKNNLEFWHRVLALLLAAHV